MEGYEIVRKIGKGSYGSVFVVKEKATGEEMVLKRIPVFDLSDKERQQTKQEVQLMQRLRHPCICAYVDSFLYNGEDMCIVMDYCRGGDLSTKIQQANQPFPEGEVLSITTQILLALQYMHGLLTLHRDLKTQNIFIREDGSVVLGDLGIAKVLARTADLATTAIGTPMYMSPEVCKGERYSFKSDVWALGCVVYELATQRHAFNSRDLNGLVLKILRGNYPPISGSYSSHLHNLINRMLSKDPAKRPLTDDILQLPLLRGHAVLYYHSLPPESRHAAAVWDQLSSLGIDPSNQPRATSHNDLHAELLSLHENHAQKRRSELALLQLQKEKKEARRQRIARLNRLKQADMVQRDVNGIKLNRNKEDRERVSLERLHRKQSSPRQQQKDKSPSPPSVASNASPSPPLPEHSPASSAVEELRAQAEEERAALEQRLDDLKRQIEERKQSVEVMSLQVGNMQPLSEPAPSPTTEGTEEAKENKKERVLRERMRRKQEAEEQQLQALANARKENLAARQVARRAEFEMYHPGRDPPSNSSFDSQPSSKPPESSPKNSSPQQPSGERGSHPPPPNDIQDIDAMIHYLESEVSHYKKQIGECVGRIESLSQQGRGVAISDNELFSPVEQGIDTYQDETEDDEAPAQPMIEDRAGVLRQQLIHIMGDSVFWAAYKLLRSRDPAADDDTQFAEALHQILPGDLYQYWVHIDQLVFMEQSMGE